MNNKNEENSNRVPIWLIIEIILVVFIIFWITYDGLPLPKYILLVDSFNKISVGLSALLAVFVGQNWIARQEEKEKKIKEFLKKYPHDKFGIEWKIIEPQSSSGAYYLFEKRREIVHHILNMKTVYDLGWHVYLNTSKKVKDDLFRSYKVGARIRTQGEAGE